MNKKHISINFCDFWLGFSPCDNYFYNLLIHEFDIEISNNPDFLFFSIFGNNNLNYKCIKIQYIGENIPPFNCDYSFSFEPTSGNNYRLPHYLLYPGYYELVNKKVDEKLLDRKFCNFLVNNPNCIERNNFFQKLSKYKKVDSGGRLFNNLGYEVNGKRQFQAQYKFSIAYENQAYRPDFPYYVTEKPFESMTVNSLPIYRGGSKINEDFNTKSFINYHDFKSEDEMIDYIIYLDKNDDKYMEVMKEPWFINNEIPENNKEENIKNFLYKIFK